MRRINVSVSVSETEIREIESMYQKSEYSVICAVVNDILCRYLNIEYFDPELYDDQYPDENDGYLLCEHCGEKAKKTKVIDLDDTNLEEHCVCENCGYGQPRLT